MPDRDSEKLRAEIDSLERQISHKETQISLLKHTIDSQRLDFAQRQQKLIGSARQLYTLLRVSINVSQAEDLELQLNFIASGIVEAELSTRVVINLIDDRWHRIPLAFAGFSEEEQKAIRNASEIHREKWLRIISAQYRIGYNSYLIPSDDPIAPDIYNLPDLAENTNTFMGGDFLILPMKDADRQITGVIILNNQKQQKKPADTAIHLLEIFSRDAARAIERHFLHRQLKYDENLLKRILDCSTDIVVTTDQLGRISMINKGAEKILGYRSSELIGKSVKQLYRKHDEARKILRIMRKGSGMVKDHKIEAKSKQGDTIPILLSAAIIYDREENELGTVGIARDQRELKWINQQLKSCQNNRIDKRAIARFTQKLSEPMQGLELTIDRILKTTRDCEGGEKIHNDLETILKLFRQIYETSTQFSDNRDFSDIPEYEQISFSDKYSILLVDDDEVVLQGISHLLQEYGLDVTSTNTAERAIEHIEEKSWDLVVTDIRLPEKDGYEVYRKAKEKDPTLPVILVTGYGYDPNHTIIRAAQDPNTRIFFKEKPVNSIELIGLLKDVLEPVSQEIEPGQ